MAKKNTDDLRQALMTTPDLSHFLTENQDSFQQESMQDILNRLFLKKNISKATLAKQAGMSEVYLHQIFSGRRNPSRNRLLCLCFGFSASLDETQELLKLCGHAQLYARSRRDAIVIYGLLHNMSLFDVNDNLLAEAEETLY